MTTFVQIFLGMLAARATEIIIFAAIDYFRRLKMYEQELKSQVDAEQQ